MNLYTRLTEEVKNETVRAHFYSLQQSSYLPLAPNAKKKKNQTIYSKEVYRVAWLVHVKTQVLCVYMKARFLCIYCNEGSLYESLHRLERRKMNINLEAQVPCHRVLNPDNFVQ